MPSGHVRSNPGTCDMPSSHMLPPTNEMYNMPSGCMVSPGMSGCMALTCTIPLTLTFPGHLPYRREAYTRHTFPLVEEEHMQDSHAFITNLKDSHNYPSPASHNIHEATPMDNPGTFLMEGRHFTQDSLTQDNLATSIMEGRHTQDRYPDRSGLLERPYIQTDLNPNDSSPDSYLLLDDSLTSYDSLHFSVTHSLRS